MGVDRFKLGSLGWYEKPTTMMQPKFAAGVDNHVPNCRPMGASLEQSEVSVGDFVPLESGGAPEVSSATPEEPPAPPSIPEAIPEARIGGLEPAALPAALTVGDSE